MTKDAESRASVGFPLHVERDTSRSNGNNFYLSRKARHTASAQLIGSLPPTCTRYLSVTLISAHCLNTSITFDFKRPRLRGCGFLSLSYVLYICRYIHSDVLQRVMRQVRDAADVRLLSQLGARVGLQEEGHPRRDQALLR